MSTRIAVSTRRAFLAATGASGLLRGGSARGVGIAQQYDASRRLWQAGVRQIDISAMEFPAGIEHAWVERSDSDRFRFLHDAAIEAHRGSLFAAWYNCPEQEIVGESVIRGRWSKDGGRTWSAPEMVAADARKEGVHYVPAQLLSHRSELHAFVGKMTGHDLIVDCAVFTRDDRRGIWAERGKIAPLFLPNCQPVKMQDGNWLMAGRVASRLGTTPRIAAVAISAGDQLNAAWKVVRLQAEELPAGHHPETTVWMDGAELVAFTRNSLGAAPYAFTSRDYGRTWRAQPPVDFETVTSKMYAGQLSTGQRYLIYNHPSSQGADRNRRNLLVIAVTRPGSFGLAKVWKVREAGEADAPDASHYPCAIEHRGRLLIVYTAGKKGTAVRQCEMSSIPVRSLALR